MGPTVLFTHLKIILLQYFQFSVFSFSNNKFNPNKLIESLGNVFKGCGEGEGKTDMFLDLYIDYQEVEGEAKIRALANSFLCHNLDETLIQCKRCI